MNSTLRYLTLLALIFMVLNKTIAQKASFETNQGMTIGFGLGSSSQRSDIANSKGGGFDFNLGSYLYKKENKLLSVDWKFRFLAGENMAHDHRITTGGSFTNIRYEFFNYDLEMGVTLNHLRERTRIVITGFAGLGITHGITTTDLLDENGNPYDYSVIDPNQERKQVYSDLLDLTDGRYETKLISKAALLPTAGIYIGYQFTHSFSLGIEHKINFSLTENNSISGINIDNNIAYGSRKDRNHYTSLGFRWILRGGSSDTGQRNNFAVIDTPAKVYYPPITERPVADHNPVIIQSPPLVEIIVPSGNTYTTTEAILAVTARTNNVKVKQDIRIGLNNNNIEFDFNSLNGDVRSTVTLAEGKNNLTITGSNVAGSSKDDLTIIYNKPPVVLVLPIVKFLDPALPVTVDKNYVAISVQTKNVKEWQDVKVSVNGTNFSNFNFNPDGFVKANIPLKEGKNSVQVTGKNEYGAVSDFATITYTKPVKASPPVINILNPGTSPFNTFETYQEIKARITGISGKENILLSFNGIRISGFTYDDSTSVLTTSITLKEGINTILITARNDAGQDVKSQEINKATLPCPFPVLKIIEPVQNELTTENSSLTIRTAIMNIVAREQISITLNDRQIANYNFNGSEIAYVASLDSGINTYVISAANNCGTQNIAYSIYYKPTVVIVEEPCLKPGINLNVTPVIREDANYDMKGSVSNVKDRSAINFTINDKSFEGFSYDPVSGEISSAFKFTPGSYTIKVEVKNECGQDSYSVPLLIQEAKSCGIRINPGNSSWEFCMITPSDTIRRETLTNNNFSYSGRAISLYFMPIAGGGDAEVQGKQYTLRPGQYYLFNGNLTVKISTKNPGSMGQWSVCIIADKEPLSGNGNNRPQSPCEEQEDNGKPKKAGEGKNN